MKNMKNLCGVLMVLAFLVGCGSQQSKDGQDNLTMTNAYDCQGEEVHVTIDDTVVPATADLNFVDRDDVHIVLPAVDTATGLTYSDGDVSFAVQADEALLSTTGTDKSLTCGVLSDVAAENAIVFDENGAAITDEK